MALKTLQAAPTLVEQVHGAILSEIASGKLVPGARVSGIEARNPATHAR